MELPDKEKRIEIVNEIIKTIAGCGRNFFGHNGEVASLFVRNNKVWYKCEYVYGNITEICLSIPKYTKPKGWFHGGTLQSLVMDFSEYIRNGGYVNGKNGYGGLMCPHWGYSTEDMKMIQNKARELGYLKPIAL